MAAVAVVGTTTVWSPPIDAANSIVTVDGASQVDSSTSVVMDAAGNPVISYYDATGRDLKLAHCNDAACAGGDESIVTADATNDVGRYSSLVLDAAGNPVVSYYDRSNGDLKLVHCNDANCSGNDESAVAVDSSAHVGEFSSLVLDAAGRPVISYHDATSVDLKVAHCNDANCAGGDESIVTVDSASAMGAYGSLKLDAAGRPVVSYQDVTNGDLRIAHCNDANCAGGGESIVCRGSTRHRRTLHVARAGRGRQAGDQLLRRDEP